MNRINAVIMMALFLVLGCSSDSDDPNGPGATTTTSIRLINSCYDETRGFDLYVAGRKVASNVRAGESGGFVDAGTFGESVEVAVHYADSVKSRFKTINRMGENQSYTMHVFGPALRPSTDFGEDKRTTNPGNARIQLVNAVSDVVRMNLSEWDEPAFLGPATFADVAQGYADVVAGKKVFSILDASGNEMYAYDTVALEPNNAYSLVLSGTQSTSDAIPVTARLYSDNGNGKTYRDLVIAPDRGKVLFVHAVPGAPAASITLDGAATPTFSSVAFSTQTNYTEILSGQHTATVTVSGTPIAGDVPFTVGKRTRTTMFVSGTTLPPNIAVLELADLKKPLAPSEGSVRIVHLSPDAPALDGYIVSSTGESKIWEFQNKGYRTTSYSDSRKGQFFSLWPNVYSMVFKKAGTNEVVVPQTNVTISAGKIVTIWIGGLSSAPAVYTVQHN
jgi:hypothetical protein